MVSLPLFLVATAAASFPVSVESFATPASLSNSIVSGPAGLQSSRRTIVGLSSAKSSDDETLFIPKPGSKGRRKIIQSVLVAPILITSLTPHSASATSEKPPPIVPLMTTAKRLHAVPLFTIVDGNGIPFHTYDKESAGAFGYFFTTYTSAEYVLDDAKKAFAKAKTEAAAKKEEGAEGAIGEDGAGEVPDAWGKAQIVTLPLDVVVQLSVKKTQSIATNGKGKKFNTYYQVIPATEDYEAALRIENGPRYGEKGRVPLFYVDGLTLPPKIEGGELFSPVYFRGKDLKDEWDRQNPGTDLPKIKVRELNETFRAMIRPGGKDNSVKNLVFVPVPESVETAKATARTYKLGEMILTK